MIIVIAAGGFLGFFGIAAAVIVLGAFVMDMKSFGVPFYAGSMSA
ncbi:MAG: spore germination protein [Clostridia bacterium]|nr:spore germination protein [Clostridia bacterium]